MELPAPCTERGAAADLFVDALKQATPPDPGWTVKVGLQREQSVLKARGELSDAKGTVVASRDFSVRGDSCAPLARAIGVWASLVLDQRKAEGPAPAEEPPKPAPAPVVKTSTVPPDPVTGPVWPSPQNAEKPSPEQALFLRHPAGSRTLELGLSTFLMNAGDTSALAGGSLFMVAEIPGGVYLRPKLTYGRNFRPLQSVDEEGRELGTARLDACLRMPGFYLERRGLSVDLCGGAEGGFLTVSGKDAPGHTVAYGAFGPGLGLRGEFANDFSAEVRVEGLMRIAEGLPIGGRAEMAITWRAR